MKALGFLISLLVHLLFVLLLLHVRFPLIEIPVKAQIIQVVPMSPPLPAEPPAPLPVYVRPFVLKGGAPGRAGTASAATGAGTKPALSRADRPRRVTGPLGRPFPPGAGSPAPLAAETAPAPPAENSPRLTIDLDRVSRKLKEKNAAARADAGGGFPPTAGLPFGDAPAAQGSSARGQGGDGTASIALGGNAFFDARGYDITPWAKRMVYRVKKNWIFPPVSLYGLKGTVGIYVLIERDGAVSRVFIRKTSNVRSFDQAAFNAIELSAPLPPLPDDYPRENLPAYLLFYYN